MNTITKPDTPTSRMLLEREDAMRVRAQEADFDDTYDYVFSKAAQFTYAQAYAEFISPGRQPNWVERTETATAYLLAPERFQWSFDEPEAAAKGREFALTIIRGLRIK